MSTISGLDINNNNLLSSSQNTTQASNSTNSQSGTTSSKPASSLNVQDVVSLSLVSNEESLIQSLFSSNSSSTQDLFSTLEKSATLNAVEKTNLFSTNPQMAEALIGVNLASGSTENTSTPTTSSSTSQPTGSSDTVDNLINTVEQSNLSQTNPDLVQSLLQALSSYASSSNSSSLDSMLNLTVRADS